MADRASSRSRGRRNGPSRNGEDSAVVKRALKFLESKEMEEAIRDGLFEYNTKKLKMNKKEAKRVAETFARGFVSKA